MWRGEGANGPATMGISFDLINQSVEHLPKSLISRKKHEQKRVNVQSLASNNNVKTKWRICLFLTAGHRQSARTR